MSGRNNVLMMSCAQLVSIAFQLASGIIVSRHLQPVNLGAFSAGLAFTSAIGLIQALGPPSLLVREIELSDDLRATAFTINIITSMILIIITVLFAYYSKYIFHNNDIREILYYMAGIPFMGAICFLPTAHLERDGRFKVLSISTVASGIAQASVSSVSAIIGLSTFSLVYGSWAGSITSTIIIISCGYRYLYLRLSFSEARRVVSYGAQILTVSGLNQLGMRLSELMMGRLRSLAELGLYGRAANINMLLWSNVHTVVGRIVLSNFARLTREGKPLREGYLHTVAMMTGVLWPLFAGVAILSGPIIRVLYGSQWVTASAPLALLAVGSIIQISVAMSWEVFSLTGRLREQSRVEVIRTSFAFGAFAIGCTVSMTAAAFARVLEAIIAVFLYRPHMRLMTGATAADFRPIYLSAAVGTIAATAPTAIVMGVFRFSPDTPLQLIAPAIAVGIVLWAVTLQALDHPLAAEMAVILRIRALGGA